MGESILQVEHLTKSFGADVLFSDISLGINEGEKVGLIAKNGTGKSTLLGIIAGTGTADSGTVVYRGDTVVGYLPQAPSFPQGITVAQACLAGDDRASTALRQYEQALASGNDQAIAAAIQAVDGAGAWDYEERFKQTLSQLKITDASRAISGMSGGELKRVALAKVLIGEPQFLILDEPTNHLDLDMVEWLERFLMRSRMTLLMVTHDRYFLDRVCSRILELDQQGLYAYDGNYAYYLEKREQRLSAQAAQTAKARNLLRTELDWMRRQPQARAHKAQYRIDAFYDLRDRAQGRAADEHVQLNVAAGYIGNKIFTARHVGKRFGNKVIASDFNYTFTRYEKLGIVGNNGVGKSTFIKMLLGIVKPDEGYFDVGDTVQFGYYSQEGIAFDEGKRVIDALTDIAEHVYFDEKTHYTAMQFLQLFLFSPAQQQKLICKLSGGERRRLYLATVLYRKPNFLILDEPTNDLDIPTLEILEDYLGKFKGCLIVVSHDRFFMDRTVDHTFVFQGEGVIKDFPGNYSEYRAWQQAHQAAAAAQPAASKPKREVTHSSKKRLSFKEQRELEQLSGELEQLEAERKQLEQLFAGGEQVEGIEGKAARYSQVKDLIDEKELRWLELSEKS